MSNSTPGNDASAIDQVLQQMIGIRARVVAESVLPRHRLEETHANFHESAANLLHYLALRRRDLRPLQSRLAALGLSSLGRAEPHVLATVDAVLEALHRLAGREREPVNNPAAVGFSDGQRLLAEHTTALLGPARAGRNARIMVTMPTEAATDYSLIHDLLNQGMDCMRINCAHDGPDVWMRMIENLRRAERALGRKCRVVMDLAGPKLRTGPLEPGPAVVRARPKRDVFGRVTAPARIWLTADDAPQSPPTLAHACLPVSASWLAELRPGGRLRLVDARESRRSMTVVDVTDRGCWAETTKTTYFVPGTVLRREPGTGREGERRTVVGTITPSENAIPLKSGDMLEVWRHQRPGRPASLDASGQVLTPAGIGCTIPEVFDDARAGEPIWFDDGKIGGIIDNIDANRALVRITYTRPDGDKLRADKGINLPESQLRLPALTAKDIEDLEFVAKNADVIELSFANTAADVESLQKRLAHLGDDRPGIVLKIETRRGFRNLPEMLLTAMRAPRCGVMIARGDLAVECGFERLAEVQEEILWICEAAHVPVIWATQVLETLAKQGMPSRAEITDAAMGHRAECVMLNKGPHMVTAVRVLDDILHRMQDHQDKKRAMLRELHLAHALEDNAPPVPSPER